MLSETQIKKFKDMYCQHFGAELTDEEALELANDLLYLIHQIYKPFPPSDRPTEDGDEK